MANIRDIGQIGEEAWNAFVLKHPFGSVYHHPLWHQAIEETYGYQSRYCTIEEDGQIVAGLPFTIARNALFQKNLISYPYSDACDPLLHSCQDMDEIARAIDDYAARNRITAREIRTYLCRGTIPGFSLEGEGTYCNFVLDLDRDADSIFRSLHHNCVQRGIRKAQSYRRMEVIEGSTLEEMRQFYDLHVMTRKWHGVPPQPFQFFKNLWETLRPPGLLSLLLARMNRITLAAVVLLRFKDVVYYKFAAADRSYLTRRPNHLLIWRIIEDALRDGYKSLDFGRTFVGDTGLIQWKTRWGGRPHAYGYYQSVGSHGDRSNREGNASRIILGSIIKRMPTCIVKLSGELFYKYLA